MCAQPVNSLVPAPKNMDPRVKAIPLFVLITFLLSTSTCPAQTEAKGESMPPDSLSALFEDIYGRFPNAATYGLDYLHTEMRNDVTYAYPAPVYTYNDAVANFTLGDRKSYQLSAGVENNAASSYHPSQIINLGVAVRPDASWQFSGAGSYSRNGGSLSTDYFNLGLSATHLSGGAAAFNESTLRQYYYFSNLFLGTRQLEFTLNPIVSGQANSRNGSENYVINVPVSLTYGLTDRITGGVNAYFYKSVNRSPSYTPGVNGSGLNGWEYRAGFDMSYLADERNAFTFAAAAYNNRLNQNYYVIYPDGSAEEMPTTNKRYFGELSASWYLSFLNKPVSIYDLRRSYYTGNYLHSGEVTNQLKATHFTTGERQTTFLLSSLSNVRTSVSDSLVVGLSNNLELSVKGGLFEGYAPSTAWARYGLAQLTFHNLRYDGAELNDFDYFFGRINTPGDYSLTVGGSLASDATPYLYIGEPDKKFQVNGRIGIIEGLDASIDYLYSKYERFPSLSSNFWGVVVRGNVLRSFRVETSMGWGDFNNQVGGLTIGSRSLNLQVSVKALF